MARARSAASQMAVEAPRPPVGGMAWIASPSAVTVPGVQSAIGPAGSAARNLNAAVRGGSESDTRSRSHGDHPTLSSRGTALAQHHRHLIDNRVDDAQQHPKTGLIIHHNRPLHSITRRHGAGSARTASPHRQRPSQTKIR